MFSNRIILADNLCTEPEDSTTKRGLCCSVMQWPRVYDLS